jgi:polyphenol oxidase
MKETSTFPSNTVMSGAPSSGGVGGAAAGEAEALRSRLLDEAGFSHAFFTRRGGVSQAPWDSLNLAVGVGDTAEAVVENLARAARALGVPPQRLYFLSQVHGSDFRVLDGTEPQEEVVRMVGDITISRTPGVGCGVRTADCVPILVADRASGVVAAIHSGWRGTAARVVVTAVNALRELIGGSGDLIAAIGPHIEVCCFEVGDDVAAELARASSLGEGALERSRSQGANPVEGSGKPRVNLRRIVRAQLGELGIAREAIDDVLGCTVCDRERFYSYRRDRDRSGRLLSAIVSRPL